MEKEMELQETLVFSYLSMRKAIGLMGVLFPFVLSLGAWFLFDAGIQDSISYYYYTGMREVFVGTLWAMGFFMLSYKGYDWKDNLAGTLACLFAVGVSLFPTSIDPHRITTWVGWVHLVSALCFFLCLIYFSLFLFTKTDPNKKPTPEKLKRNWVYRACGYTMVICMLLLAIYILNPEKEHAPLAGYNPIFWLEAVAVLAFGISWLVKGEAILKDALVRSTQSAAA